MCEFIIIVNQFPISLLGEKKKARGNFWYSRDEFQTAISCYRKCVEVFENVNEDDLDAKAHRLLTDCYNNLSLTQLKLDSLNAALESVDKALSYDSKNVKSLYRKAQILEKKNDLEEAVQLLKIAIELEPSNTSVANLLIKLRMRRLTELENEKELCQKMISNNRKKPVQSESKYGSFAAASPDKASPSKRFNYILFAISAIITIILAFLINNYLANYA